MSETVIGATKFKEHCLALLDNLRPEGLVIMKRGKPVARLVPCPRPPQALIGCLSDTLTVRGDILSTGLVWDADDQA